MADISESLRGLLALAPILVLFVLVASNRLQLRSAGLVALVLAVVIAVLPFGATPTVVGVSLAKGAWLGVWILLVVWPALLLFQIASANGMSKVSDALLRLRTNRGETLLLLGWILPSFVQGIAGFGTPIAVAAPLLLAMGWSPVRSVLYAVIGYHWSVTFGSMASSFYMASLTAGFGPSQEAAFALQASMILAVNCLAAGSTLLLLDGGVQRFREGLPLLLIAGIPMGLVLILVATLVPAIASVTSGLAGLTMAGALISVRRQRSDRMAHVSTTSDLQADPASTGDQPQSILASLVHGLSPYLVLVGIALPVFLISPLRAMARSAVAIGPAFPRTETALGWTNEAVDDFSPLVLFAHPGFYLVIASVVALLLAIRDKPGVSISGGIFRSWGRSLTGTSLSILLFAGLAMVMVDSGMVSALAVSAASLTGSWYPALAAPIGALGSFITGSTTSSNALFTAFQTESASLLGFPGPVMAAAQTVGGNIGNIIAPVVVLIGASAVGAPDEAPRIMRAAMLPALLMFVPVTLFTML